jgi:hypothetical protein
VLNSKPRARPHQSQFGVVLHTKVVVARVDTPYAELGWGRGGGWVSGGEMVQKIQFLRRVLIIVSEVASHKKTPRAGILRTAQKASERQAQIIAMLYKQRLLSLQLRNWCYRG